MALSRSFADSRLSESQSELEADMIERDTVQRGNLILFLSITFSCNSFQLPLPSLLVKASSAPYVKKEDTQNCRYVIKHLILYSPPSNIGMSVLRTMNNIT